MLALFCIFLVVIVGIWAIRYLMGAFKTPEPIQAVVYVLLVVLVVFFLLSIISGSTDLSHIRVPRL